jgi:hypothetical protein
MMQYFQQDNYLTRSFREIRRMFPALVISVVVLYMHTYGWLAPNSPLLLVLHRAALATIGFCVAHIVRQPAFPYLDLKAEMERGNIGAQILVGLIYMAFILGTTLGF